MKWLGLNFLSKNNFRGLTLMIRMGIKDAIICIFSVGALYSELVFNNKKSLFYKCRNHCNKNKEI